MPSLHQTAGTMNELNRLVWSDAAGEPRPLGGPRLLAGFRAGSNSKSYESDL